MELGLSVARRFAEAMDGALVADESAGGGLTNAAPDPARDLAPAHERSAVSRGLVIDDDPGLRRALAINLRAREYDEGKLVGHRQLLQEVWGPAYGIESNYLRVYIAQLLRKLEPDPSSPRHLITEPGLGYRFVA